MHNTWLKSEARISVLRKFKGHDCAPALAIALD